MHPFVIDVEVAVLRDDGRYLMAVRGEGEEHAAGLIAFPSGGVDPELTDDILEATAIREVAEETGLRVDTLEYVRSHSFTLESEQRVVVVLFIAKYAGGVPRVIDANEVSALDWMSVDEIVSLPETPSWIREMLASAERKRLALGW